MGFSAKNQQFVKIAGESFKLFISMGIQPNCILISFAENFHIHLGLISLGRQLKNKGHGITFWRIGRINGCFLLGGHGDGF